MAAAHLLGPFDIARLVDIGPRLAFMQNQIQLTNIALALFATSLIKAKFLTCSVWPAWPSMRSIWLMLNKKSIKNRTECLVFASIIVMSPPGVKAMPHVSAYVPPHYINFQIRFTCIIVLIAGTTIFIFWLRRWRFFRRRHGLVQIAIGFLAKALPKSTDRCYSCYAGDSFGMASVAFFASLTVQMLNSDNQECTKMDGMFGVWITNLYFAPWRQRSGARKSPSICKSIVHLYHCFFYCRNIHVLF